MKWSEELAQQKVLVLSSEMKECHGCGDVITVMGSDRLTCHSLYLISGVTLLPRPTLSLHTLKHNPQGAILYTDTVLILFFREVQMIFQAVEIH